jgi:hypothetical protein
VLADRVFQEELSEEETKHSFIPTRGKESWIQGEKIWTSPWKVFKIAGIEFAWRVSGTYRSGCSARGSGTTDTTARESCMGMIREVSRRQTSKKDCRTYNKGSKIFANPDSEY